MKATGKGARPPVSGALGSSIAAADGSARSVYLSIGALLAALLFFRKPESLLHPQFWAEDGSLFFQGAYNQGFLKTLLAPAAGYLHALPRLVAGLSLGFPIDLAPLIFNLAAFVVQLGPSICLLSPRMSNVIPSFPARVLAALLYVCLPASYETHVNITNAHWYLTLTAAGILVAKPAAGSLARALETLTVALFSLTGPFSILFLPLVAPRLVGGLLKKVRLLRGGAPAQLLVETSGTAPATHGRNLALIIAAGAAIQAGFALTSPRVVGAVLPSGGLSPGEWATVVSMHTVFSAVFGVNRLGAIYQALPPAAYGIGLAALAFLLFIAIRDRVTLLLILFYLASMTVVLSFAFPLNDPRLWLHPVAGPRYFLFAGIFVLGALLHLACAGGALRSLGIGTLIVAVAIGVREDFFHPRQPDVRWTDNAAVFSALPAGASFYAPVTPLYFPGMTLHKRSAPRGRPVLDGLRAVASRTPYAASLGRPERLFLNQEPNDRFLGVDGWAVDGEALGPAGGVFVRIDEKLYPAVYGLKARIDVGGRVYTDCGFTRLIPIAEIGPGTHRFSLVVLTRDKTGYFQPSPARTFTTSEFFPSGDATVRN